MAKAIPRGWGGRLRRERERRGWSQKALAEKVNAGEHSVYRWEAGKDQPRAEALQSLINLFGKPPEAWGKTIWQVPYFKNLYFTGRERILRRLHASLSGPGLNGREMRPVALSQTHAISGLGGIGKTQTAVEYAYRYGEEYDLVLWVRADSREALLAEYAGLAPLIGLSAPAEPHQEDLAKAVKRKLETQEEQVWLLILDNVEDLQVVREFLPTRGTGAILLTTRLHDVGPSIRKLKLDPFTQEEGVQFFLARLGAEQELEQPALAETDLEAAQQLWTLLGGLPLALDQAAAFVQETGSSLAEYRQLFHQARGALLRRRGLQAADHLDSVAVTFELAWEQVHQLSPASAALLRLSAFLAPDAIPEELFTKQVAELPDPLCEALEAPLGWQEVIGLLRRYSLLEREGETKTLSVHRLVQAVLREELDRETQRCWAEKAIGLVNAAFPLEAPETWTQCERLLPQALQVTQWIEQHQIVSEETGRLLFETACYLQSRGRMAEVEPLCQRALQVWEQLLGPEHPQLANALNILGGVSRYYGRYAEAEQRCQRALGIREQQLGPEHPQVANPLINLAILYTEQGRYAEAEPLYRRALVIREQQLGPGHDDTALVLNNLANLYSNQGRYAEAEPLYRRSLDIWEQLLGPESPRVAYPLCGLGDLYREQGKDAEAEPLYLRAQRIWEQLGPENLWLAAPLTGLATLYREQGKGMEAERLYLRALRLWEPLIGTLHPEQAETMHGLARLREAQGNREEARQWYEQAFAVREQALGAHHPKTIETCQRLIALLHALRRHEEAAQLEMAQAKRGGLSV